MIVEFSTLGEYRLGADGVVYPASALAPASERVPQLGGAGDYPVVAQAAVRRIVAGGAVGKRRPPPPRPGGGSGPRHATVGTSSSASRSSRARVLDPLGDPPVALAGEDHPRLAVGAGGHEVGSVLLDARGDRPRGPAAGRRSSSPGATPRSPPARRPPSCRGASPCRAPAPARAPRRRLVRAPRRSVPGGGRGPARPAAPRKNRTTRTTRTVTMISMVDTAAGTRTTKGRPGGRPKLNGGDLLSQALASQVPSALRGLTALFGMGRGVSPSLSPPKTGETGPRPAP